MRESITILRAGAPTTDRYGNAVPGAETPTVSAGWRVAPNPQGENRLEGRQAIIDQLTCYGPLSADVLATDRVIARGGTYIVDGEPQEWGRSGQVIELRRVKG